MTDWDRVKRLLGQDTMDHLARQTVAVVGLGSGGGYVAVALAMTGVRKFVLVDDDILDAHNVVRHIADQRDVGRPKVAVVGDLIRHRNPEAEIQQIHGRIEDHFAVLDTVDMVVVGVDSEGSKFSLNEACLERHLTAVYAGVYERGEGGDVVTIYPYKGPCYACWASALREGNVSPSPDDADEDLDYGQLRADGTLAAEPGLWLDVVRVANTQASVTLNSLLAGTPARRDLPANTVILASQPLEILEGHLTPPFSAEWVDIARNPSCLVCGTLQTRQSEADISLDALLNETGEADTSQSVHKSGKQNHD
ncbi:MAG: ThiF family adenylyltransferase [Chloroflexi bacterium]|nr:ThiF family adenylyltransferase [Chloroflexota bacterium]